MAIFATKKQSENDAKLAETATDDDKKIARQFKHLTDEESAAVMKIVRRPHVTEKATNLQSGRIYSFQVAPAATKFAVKRAIEKAYRVHVETVRMVNIPKKSRMRGKLAGWKKGLRKAMVKIKAGETIEM